MKTNQRHHSAHPPSGVKHNPSVNQHPNPAAIERAALPPANNNPSLGPIVSVDTVNARLSTFEVDLPSECDPDAEPEDSDPDAEPEDGDGRKKPSATSVY